MNWSKTWWTGLMCAACLMGQPKKDAPAAPDKNAPIFRTETRLVPVDVVVTDRKGNYIHDLEAKDFRVWEDNKEQPIKNFSFEADPNSPLATQLRYIVLFFDNSSMAIGEQAQARQAAVKFIDANAGPNRLMAVANFGGSLRIAQNFTDDIERLKQVVSGVKTASLSTNDPAGTRRTGIPRLGSEAQLGARSVLLSLRDLAKGLEDIPGRKTLVFLSSGFPLPPELMPEVTAAIDACNKANVAIYPIDVRGLSSLPFAPFRGSLTGPQRNLAYAGVAMAGSPVLRIASFLAAPQRGGAGAGAGGGTTGGGATGGGGGAAGGTGAGAGGGGAGAGGGGGDGGGARGGGGGIGGGNVGGSSSGGNNPGSGNPGGIRGTNNPGNPGGNTGGFGGGSGNENGFPGRGGRGGDYDPNRGNPLNRPREIFGPRNMPESALDNQHVLYRLAEGTGGFVIANTNDMLGGLQKINKEQNEYYLLAYTAPESAEGTCHEIRVKVSRGGSNVRSRPGYCNVKSKDPLAGKPLERKLETRVTGTEPGTIPAPPMQAAFTYTASNTARVNVALEIPTKDIKFEKVKGKQHAEINVLGIAYRPNGDVGARFSDTVNFDFDEKKAAEKFAAKPYDYQNQFDIGSGQYSLKVVFSSGGESFGKLERALNIGDYDTAQFGMSDVVVSRETRKVSGDLTLDAELMEGRTPLVAGTMQFLPAGSLRFKAVDTPTIYFEVYEPLLLDASAAAKTKLGGQLKVFDVAGEQKLDSGGVDLTRYLRPGSSVVPVGLKLPVSSLKPGNYRVEILVVDSADKHAVRSVEFEVI